MGITTRFVLGSLGGQRSAARRVKERLRAASVLAWLALFPALAAVSAPATLTVQAGLDDRSSEESASVQAPLEKDKTPSTNAPRDETPRVASRTNSIRTPALATPPSAAAPAASEASALAASTLAVLDPVAMAKQAIADCQKRFAHVRDYTCTFLKRERIEGQLTSQHVMGMKARTTPASVYFKFQKPNKGREAIFVTGRNKGKVVAHDVGFGKFLAGTMHLDPRGTMAMEECRHPITEAGIGSLIELVAKHWASELSPEESVLSFHPNMRIGNHACTMIESAHLSQRPNFLFHKVRLYIDLEHGLPIRFEAYDWPKHPGAAAELIEEYTYLDLRVNVGLTDHDFDPNNKSYSFGRF
jgi:outer membrane lipoprotein-sorting protein